VKHVLLSVLMIATYLAFAGSSLEAASDPRATQLTYEPWIKFCFGASKCFVGAGAKGECFPSGGSVSIITDNQKESLSARLGTTRTLAGAISVQIDQGAPILIRHPECQTLSCGGSFEIDSDFIERLKRSQMITIEATDSHNQRIGFSLSLADFAQAYDGPESDPPKVTEMVLTPEKYKEMTQREEERRKALECKE
jgi:invasion protein IalB